MNFSLYNKEITYSFTWGRPLKVCGKGKVCEQDLDVKYDGGERPESLAEWLIRFKEPILRNTDLKYYLETANRRFGKK